MAMSSQASAVLLEPGFRTTLFTDAVGITELLVHGGP
jgi:hypothetical protein